MNWLNKALAGIATVVGIAGAVVALPVGALPATVVVAATKILTYGTVAGVVAAKVLPGHGENKPGPK